MNLIEGLSNIFDRSLPSELIGGLSNGMIYKAKIFCFGVAFHTRPCMCT